MRRSRHHDTGSGNDTGSVPRHQLCHMRSVKLPCVELATAPRRFFARSNSSQCILTFVGVSDERRAAAVGRRHRNSVVPPQLMLISLDDATVPLGARAVVTLIDDCGGGERGSRDHACLVVAAIRSSKKKCAFTESSEFDATAVIARAHTSTSGRLTPMMSVVGTL